MSAGWDAKCALGKQHDPALEFLALHSRRAQFEVLPTDSDAPRSELSVEISSFHCNELSGKPGQLDASTEELALDTRREYTKNATASWESCNEIESQLGSVVGELDGLLGKHRFVTEKTRTLREACENLVSDKQSLVEYLNQLDSHLRHFRQLEAATALSEQSAAAMVGNEFFNNLGEIEAAVHYFESSPGIKGVEAHLVHLRHAVTRSMSRLRDYIVAELKVATKKVNQEMHVDMAARGGNVDVSIAVRHFQTMKIELQPLVAQLESRPTSPEAMGLLMDIHENYQAARETILYPMALSFVANLGDDLPNLLRSACSYLCRICADEYALLRCFFVTTGPASAKPYCRRMLESLWGVLHDVVRPMIISQLALEILCEVIHVIKFEVLQEQIRRRGDVAELLEPIVMRLMQDAQERLIYRTQAHIVEEIGSYYPTPADLDYPKRLEGQDPRDRRHYFPTLDRTLFLLSKVYQCLDQSVFEGIAQEAVSLCVASFISAGKTVGRRSSTVDGHLFVIKHLYLLREQIAGFEFEAVEEVELDLGFLSSSLSMLLAGTGRGSIFSLSTANPLFAAVRTVNQRLNSKQDLESELKAACENLILDMTKTIAGPIINFLSKAPKAGIPVASEALVTEAIDATRENLDKVLLPRLAKMKLYLAATPLVDNLLDPVKESIEKTAMRLHQAVMGTDEVPPSSNLQALIAFTKAINSESGTSHVMVQPQLVPSAESRESQHIITDPLDGAFKTSLESSLQGSDCVPSPSPPPLPIVASHAQ